MAKNAQVCCSGCGRETSAADGLCINCRPAVPSRRSLESKGRKSRNVLVIGGNPIAEEDPDDLTPDEQYHGSHVD